MSDPAAINYIDHYSNPNAQKNLFSMAIGQKGVETERVKQLCVRRCLFACVLARCTFHITVTSQHMSVLCKALSIFHSIYSWISCWMISGLHTLPSRLSRHTAKLRAALTLRGPLWCTSKLKGKQRSHRPRFVWSPGSPNYNTPVAFLSCTKP